MVFSDIIFLFIFLPIVLGVYYLLPRIARNYWLFAASLFFYAWGEPSFVYAMLGSIAFNYVMALLIDCADQRKGLRRALLVVAVAGNLSLMFVFKYLNFTIANLNRIFPGTLVQTNIALPIGISFFTFQAMSYVIDVYRRNVKVQRNPIYLGMYVAFFPQLIAGPIVRYETIEAQVRERTVTHDDFYEGCRRFLIGFAKKVLLANQLSVAADYAFGFTDNSMATAWLGIICYSMQILFDFSGYSEMAIGLGRMFGFRFLENFRYPYVASTVSDFWRRWHISLGTWFRDYVYLPMGGSRVASKWKLVRNLFVVWFLTGVWHGANWTFVLWGLLYFALLTAEKLTGLQQHLTSPLRRGGYRVFTLLCVMFGWVLFRANTLSDAVHYMANLFGAGGSYTGMTLFYLREYAVELIFGIVLSTPLAYRVAKRARESRALISKPFALCSDVAYLVLLLVGVSALVIGTHNPFIYFNF